MRRGAKSVPENIREGNRRLKKDRIYHFSVAAGSASEIQGALDTAVAWGYVTEAAVAEAKALIDRELAMLWRLTHPRP